MVTNNELVSKGNKKNKILLHNWLVKKLKSGVKGKQMST